MILIENNLEQKDIKKIEKLSKKLDIFDKPLTRKRVNSFGFYFKITNTNNLNKREMMEKIKIEYFKQT